MELKNKTAIITGSTSGIGLGIAKGFAGERMNIVMNGFGDPDAIENTRRELEGLGAKVIYSDADMSRPEAIVNMVEDAAQNFGSVDIVVNNAGIQYVAPVDEFPPEKWDAIIAINMSSAFHTTRSALKYMKQNGWGRIINIASAHALVASPYKSAYVTAKHGLLGFTRTVALEVAEQGITCNAICPGYVYTPLVKNQIADTAKARNMTEEDVVSKVLLAAQWTRKFVTVDQLAGTALFLCSAAADNITGIALPVDGGWTAG